MTRLVSIDPYTEAINGEYEAFSFDQCTAAVDRARRHLPEWQNLPVAERAGLLKGLITVLEGKKHHFARVITKEMGKPIRQAVAEISKTVQLCEYYRRNSHNFLRNEIIATEAVRSYVAFEPLGVILGIMPWNYPFWQVLRFAVPALVAGNVCLLKHASNVPIAAMEIEKLFVEAGFPAAVFQTLLADAKTAEELIEQDAVDGVSLTGSVAAGSRIGSLAGRKIKKLVLELGGSDPFIVLEDADVQGAAARAVKARTSNTGQSCIAAKRFIVVEAVAEEFREAFTAHLRAAKMGNPMEEETDLGPLARKDLVDEVGAQLADALSKGAKVAYGPEPPAGKGFFFRPAVLTDVTPQMRVVSEEVFGPLAPIIVVKDEQEAIEVANATEFGLGASIWSGDIERAEGLSRRIRAGFVAVNSIAKSDPRLPFGGIKRSGVGRELSQYGLLEFVNVKTVVVNKPCDQSESLRISLSIS